MSRADRLTSTQPYRVAHRELLTTPVPSKPLHQAPRMCVTIPEALEKFAIDASAVPFMCVFAQQLLLQNLGTMRFSDHRGLNQVTSCLAGSGFAGRCARSKTVVSKLVVDASCYIVIAA